MARGGLFSLVGQGIGLATEYHHHRREQAQARETAQREASRPGESSSTPVVSQEPVELPADQPPSYAESARESERSLASGGDFSTSGKRTPSPYEGDSDYESETCSLNSLEDDEGDWELDELEKEEGIILPGNSSASTAGLPSYEESEASKEGTNLETLVREVVAMSSQASNSLFPRTPQVEPTPKSWQPLPYPVILPQRRPRTKSRGFIRAYSPVLAGCGIDQKTFLAFLKNFHKASQASPIFPVIQISAAIAGFAPSVIAMAVTTAVQIAATTGAEIQARARTNKFLDRMNEDLFKPHGLYAMIIKYKPEAETSGRQNLITNLIKVQRIDLSTNQSIAKYVRNTSDGSLSTESHSLGGSLQKLRLASNTTRGAIELPEAAPLIFPNLDYNLEHEGPEKFKDKTKDAKKFLADYLDRRAQMKYAMQDPDSSLALPEGQRGFTSKLADPTHPMYSGGLVTLVSGGKVGKRAAKHERYLEKREDRRERRMDRDVRRFEKGHDLRSKREGKRARKYGDDYLEEFSHRTGRRGGRGGLIGQLAGVVIDNAQRGQTQRPENRSDLARGRGGISPNGGRELRRRGRRDRGGPGGAVRRMMQEDVLYLMVVNMPSDAELAEAQQELELSRS